MGEEEEEMRLEAVSFREGAAKPAAIAPRHKREQRLTQTTNLHTVRPLLQELVISITLQF